jgi:hypothetical protein
MRVSFWKAGTYFDLVLLFVCSPDVKSGATMSIRFRKNWFVQNKNDNACLLNDYSTSSKTSSNASSKPGNTVDVIFSLKVNILEGWNLPISFRVYIKML